MGISLYFAEAIAAALAGHPVSGRAFTVGRQTMLFTPEEAVRIAGSTADPASLETDSETRAGSARLVTDRAFFRLLGIEMLESIDVSDYEHASIVHDLNHPIPDELEAAAGLIVDGSTLDNVFNPAQALMNLSRMLAAGGRLLALNVGSNHGNPYSIPTPLWLHDYFVVNRFRRVAVYVILHQEAGLNVFAVDPATMMHGPIWTDNLAGPYSIGLLVFAEKGPGSTWAVTPVQHQYRSPAQQAAYLDHIAALRPVHDLLASSSRQLIPAPAGYRFLSGPGLETPPDGGILRRMARRILQPA